MKRPLLALALLFPLLVGCAIWRTPLELPTGSSLIVGSLVVHSDFPLANDDRLLQELDAMRVHVTTELVLPESSRPVEVYLFQSPSRFTKFVRSRFPELTDRRAFFVEGEPNLAVYAQWSDHAAEDLRHEVSHAYLHAVLHAVPLWVDEGLAENFEVPREQRGINPPHIELLMAELQRGAWDPNLDKLAQIESVSKMRQIDYAESWAWMHYLLHTNAQNRQLLTQYLADLAQGRSTEDLSDQLRRSRFDCKAQMLDHLARLQQSMRQPTAQPVQH